MGLYNLHKDKIPNQLLDYTYFKHNGDFIQFISNLITYFNICINNSIKCGLLSLPILLDKKKAFLNQFNNDNLDELELDMKLILISDLFRPSFFQTLDKKSISVSK